MMAQSPVIAISGDQHLTDAGPPVVATPLAQGSAAVTTGAASGRPFAARDVPASSGCWVEQDVFIGSSPQLAWGFYFFWSGLEGVTRSLGTAWCQALCGAHDAWPLFVILSSAVCRWDSSSCFTKEDIRLRESDQLAWSHTARSGGVRI